jgi:poly(hydroxyalkanoate) granule-associated protein
MTKPKGYEELVAAGRRVWLAGLGTVASVQESGTDLFRHLVKEGRRVEKRERTAAEKAYRRSRERVRELGSRVEANVQGAVTTTLHRLGIPSSKEINDLVVRLEQLQRRVSTLAAQR